MFCKINDLFLRLLVVIFVIFPLKSVNETCLAVDKVPVSINDASNLLTCLNSLTDGNMNGWGAVRANGNGQTLRDHLFQNHNGADGHTAVVQANGENYHKAIEIANAVAQIVITVNQEILRRVQNANAGVVVDNFQILANSFANLPLRQQQVVLGFFNSHTKRRPGAQMRRFGISLRQDTEPPAAVRIRKNGIIIAPRKLWIYLPAAAQLATTPETVYLD